MFILFDFTLQYTIHNADAMPPKKRTTPFNEDDVVAYGLEICESAPTTKQVLSVSPSGVATRFERVAKSGFFRIWCDMHQLDLVLQALF
jgi:hypothetical protein